MTYRNNRERDLIRELSRYYGETVTIFTTSGGESGRGFTGVLIGVSSDPFVKLLSQFGPGPGCALGSFCDRNCCGNSSEYDNDNDDDEMEQNKFKCRRIKSTGTIVDIPIDKIAAFVHNTLK